jgi:hypothetical protein
MIKDLLQINNRFFKKNQIFDSNYFILIIHSVLKLVFNLYVAKIALGEDLNNSFAVAYGFSPFISLFSRVSIPRLHFTKASKLSITIYDFIVPISLNLVLIATLFIFNLTIKVEAIIFLFFCAVSSDFIIEFSKNMFYHLREKTVIFIILIITLFYSNSSYNLIFSYSFLSVHAIYSALIRLDHINFYSNYKFTDFSHIINEGLKSIPASVLSLFSLNFGLSTDFIIISRTKGVMDLISSVEISALNNKVNKKSNSINLKKLITISTISILFSIVSTIFFSYSYELLLISLTPVLYILVHREIILINTSGMYALPMFLAIFFSMLLGFFPLTFTNNLSIIMFYIIFGLMQVLTLKYVQKYISVKRRFR